MEFLTWHSKFHFICSIFLGFHWNQLCFVEAFTTTPFSFRRTLTFTTSSTTSTPSTHNLILQPESITTLSSLSKKCRFVSFPKISTLHYSQIPKIHIESDLDMKDEDYDDEEEDYEYDDDDDDEYYDDEDEEEDDFAADFSQAMDVMENTPVGELEPIIMETIAAVLFGTEKDGGALEEMDDGEAYDLADWYFSRILEERDAGNDKATPTPSIYNAVMRKRLQLEEDDSLEKAHSILTQMMELYESTQDSNMAPNAESFNIILDAYTQLDEEESLEKAHSIVTKMMDLYESTKDSKMAPKAEHFNILLAAYTKRDEEDSLKKANSILTQMIHLYESTEDPKLKPNNKSFNILLAKYAKPEMGRIPGMDDEAWELFQTCENILGTNPNIESYVHAIEALAQSRNRDASYRAEDVLRELVDIYANTYQTDPTASLFQTRTFNIVLTSIAKCSDEESPDRASDLLTWLAELNNTYPDLKPNIFSFTAVIDAFAQRNDFDYTRRAEGIWNQMLTLYLSGESDIEPDIFCSTIVISSYTRLAKKGSRDGAKLAERILNRLENLYRDGKTTVKPDAVAYFTVLNAWAFTKRPEAAENAQAILHKMEQLYQEGDEKMAPSRRTYRMLIEAWTKNFSPDAMENAEVIFKRMEENCQDSGEEDDAKKQENMRHTYRLMINGWAQRRDAKKAEFYLRDMIEKHVIPDSFCFDKVIDCWAQNDDDDDEDALQRASDVFDLAEASLNAGDLIPNERFFTSFIRVIAKSEAPGKAENAQRVLNKMKAVYEDSEDNEDVRPTVYSYNAVLTACAKTDGPDLNDLEVKKAFEVAIITFNELRNSGEKPDHVTYSTLLKVCSNLLPMGGKRDAMVEATFKSCIQSGCFNEYIFEELQSAASEDLYVKLVGDPDIEFEELPQEWGKNLKQSNSRGKRNLKQSNSRGKRQFNGRRNR